MMRGSPPRVWGIRVQAREFLRERRFTPTRVGNTCTGQRVPAGTPVHPHACGEYAPRLNPELGCLGSPPRVWGIREAGDRSGSPFAVPPHACGEYVVAPVVGVWRNRFTPTRVGNTNSTYPRLVASIGSPPRVWGILPPRTWGRGCFRFTPTRVGNTVARPILREASPVHPHACGEYVRAGNPAIHLCGSPPRVWGIPSDTVRRLADVRFTPTRVGNTAPGGTPSATMTVHPHACGEYAREPTHAP